MRAADIDWKIEVVPYHCIGIQSEKFRMDSGQALHGPGWRAQIREDHYRSWPSRALWGVWGVWRVGSV